MFVYLLLMRGISQVAVDVIDPMDYLTASAVTVAPTTGQVGSSNLHEVLLARSRSERVVQPWLKKVNTLLRSTTPQTRIGCHRRHLAYVDATTYSNRSPSLDGEWRDVRPVGMAKCPWQ